jgi:two-component system CheB/CheR fusion protein
VAGIGASAGGLEAFTTFLKALHPGSGMAFVLVQHMDPTHESMLSKILGKTTEMPVDEVTNGMRVQPDHVYVAPPDADMTIHGGMLKLTKRKASKGMHLPIDVFLTSLAEDQKSAAIGVVLSGIASDGTLGLKAIKEVGGITFAQDEKSARHPGIAPQRSRRRLCGFRPSSRTYCRGTGTHGQGEVHRHRTPRGPRGGGAGRR